MCTYIYHAYRLRDLADFNELINNTTSAVAWRRTLLQAKPDSPTRMVDLAAVLGKEGQHAEAQALFQAALSRLAQVSMYVCMFVCLYVCMYVYVHVYLYVCVHMHICHAALSRLAQVYPDGHMEAVLRMHVCIHIYLRLTHTHTHTHTQVYPDGHVETVLCMHDLACSLRQANEAGGAQKAYALMQRAAEMARHIGGEYAVIYGVWMDGWISICMYLYV